MQHGLLKPAGLIQVTDLDGKMLEGDTQQCVHCGGHWVYERGSGKPHVTCGRCRGDTCSNTMCMKYCYPVEKRLDDIAKFGKPIWPE